MSPLKAHRVGITLSCSDRDPLLIDSLHFVIDPWGGADDFYASMYHPNRNWAVPRMVSWDSLMTGQWFTIDL